MAFTRADEERRDAPDSADDRSDRPLARLAAAYALGVSIFALYAAQLAARRHLTHYWADDWWNVAERAASPWVTWLFTPHNGHQIPATRALFQLDYAYFGGSSDLPIAVSLLSTAASFGVLTGLLRGRPVMRGPLGVSLLAFLAYGLLWAGLQYGFLWGFAVHAPMTVLCVLASVACFSAHAARPAARGLGLPLAAVAAACLATLSSGAGLAVWPALLVVALAARLPLRTSASLVALGAAAAVLLGVGGEQLDLIGGSLGHPLRILAFTCEFLGVPASLGAEALFDLDTDATYRTGRWIGGAALAGAAIHAARELARPRDRDAARLLALGLMGFAVAAGLAAALGRSSAFPGTSLRFAPWSMLFWMGAALALASGVERPSLRWAVALALPAVSIAMLPSLGPRLETHERLRAVLARQSLAILVGVPSEIVFRGAWLHQRSGLVDAVRGELERDGRGPFADARAAWVGQPVADIWSAAPPPRCDGGIEGWVLSGERFPFAVQASGWVSNVGLEAAPVSLIVADPEGVVRGLGNVRPREDAPWTAWYAFVAQVHAERLYSVYVTLADGSACLIERVIGADGPRIRKSPF